MKRFLLASTLVILAATSAQADDNSPTPTSPIKRSLQVLYPRVAAGGIANEAHQSEFTIRALDVKGRPLAGISVELPQIWKGKKQLGAQYPDHDEAAVPRVEWPSGKTAVTDVKGEVHGLFTSGQRVGRFTLRGIGGTTADIEQIWNDEPYPYEGMIPFVTNDAHKIPYKMSLRRGNKMVPIEGHHLELMLERVTLETYKNTGVLDEDGQPKLEDGPFEWKLQRPEEDIASEENLRWEKISSWFLFSNVHEESPGIYQGSAIVPLTIPRDNYSPLLFGDILITSVNSYASCINDRNVYKED